MHTKEEAETLCPKFSKAAGQGRDSGTRFCAIGKTQLANMGVDEFTKAAIPQLVKEGAPLSGLAMVPCGLVFSNDRTHFSSTVVISTREAIMRILTCEDVTDEVSKTAISLRWKYRYGEAVNI